MKRCPQCGRAYSDVVTICPSCKISLDSKSTTSKISKQIEKATISDPNYTERKKEPDVIKASPYKTNTEKNVKSSPRTLNKFPILIILLIIIVIAIFLFSKTTKSIPYTSSSDEYSEVSTRDTTYSNTAESISSNKMNIFIDGASVEMELKSASISNSNIRVVYESLNPRGEKAYTLTLYVDKNCGIGTYSSTDSKQKVSVSLYDCGNGEMYEAKKYNSDYAAKKVGKKEFGSYTCVITERSDDWLTYSGELNAEVESFAFKSSLTPSSGNGTSSTYKLSNGIFNFTIQQ